MVLRPERARPRHLQEDRRIYDFREGRLKNDIKLPNWGWAERMDGHPVVDHVRQRTKGGASSRSNYLPACTRCDRLRWGRGRQAPGDPPRRHSLVRKEIKTGSDIGMLLADLRDARLLENYRRTATAARQAVGFGPHQRV